MVFARVHQTAEGDLLPQKLAEYYGVGAVPGFEGRASDPRRGHLPELMGLRGVAILIVVCGHLLQRVERFYGETSLVAWEKFLFNVLATPFTGCRLLFFISGYALMISLQDKGQSSHRSSAAIEIKKRFLRIWPPYFMVLAATLLFLSATGYKPSGTYQFESKPDSLVVSFLFSLVFLHDLIFDTFPRLFPPGWYLEVHVQFFLVGAWVWRWYLKIRAGAARLSIGVMLLILFLLVSSLAMEYGSRGIRYSVIAFMPYFWAGALLADFRIHRDGDQIDRALRRVWLVGWLGLAALIILGAPFGDALVQLSGQVICLGLIIRASFVGRTNFQRALVSRWLAKVGVASYSIYLVHLQILQVVIELVVINFRQFPVFMLVALCVFWGLSAVMAVSFLFYWLVERPWMVVALRASPSSETSDAGSRKEKTFFAL
ncbi:peptidoglycan/LPS O-acetylase OafA/YrhL [Bosea sp. BE125]|uniref:acyltransferase family protein n=1 Tax=Bosea sp. BE125 TaxID=2817909 RepID=UPI002864354D|nr:acyltransferase [Bosea sp. BE125]MDR6872843.1 peptidoglycan/LPS O-acetylase OafA/YrhL [Bosea sp. BE125]